MRKFPICHGTVTCVWHIGLSEPSPMKNSGHLRIEEIKLLPGQEWIDEADAWRFCIVTTGAAYWLGASPRALNQGEMIVLSPSLKAVVLASQLNDVLLHEFAFAPRLLHGFLTFAERHSIEAGQSTARFQPQFLSASATLCQRFSELLSRRPEPNRLTERAELLGLVAGFFDAEHALPGLTANLLPPAQHRFERLMLQMPEMEIVRRSTAELARLCGCSSRHFNRLFREHFGQSLRSRQTEMRLLQAWQMLLETNTKVTEVAVYSGYRSLSLFNALFKKRYGLSPSMFRKIGDSGFTKSGGAGPPFSKRNPAPGQHSEYP